MHPTALSALILLLCSQVLAARELTGATAKALLQSTNVTVSTSVDAEGASGTAASASASATGRSNPAGAGFGTIRIRDGPGFGVRSRGQFAADIAKAVEEVQSGRDVFGLSTQAVRAFADTIAEEFTSATSRRSPVGGRFPACVQRGSLATAAARVYARILIEVLVRASDDISFADPVSAVDAVVEVTTAAFVSAQSALCSFGESPESTAPSDLSSAIEGPYTQITDLALALVAASPFIVDQISVNVEAGALVVTTVGGLLVFDVLFEETDPPILEAISDFEG